ncbi:hypothetical protein CSUI_009745 [Cystoisospora suis]|uniref:Uncharacterized protein n=1 Tax=Cystoisospora suis TaxID=483139 RepID=A0A2C6KJ71_9APIC|nr:hypothetical protein CSUI_009745 [Cystoisospora suis]
MGEEYANDQQFGGCSGPAGRKKPFQRVSLWSTRVQNSVEFPRNSTKPHGPAW